jgi:hypothetical protein
MVVKGLTLRRCRNLRRVQIQKNVSPGAVPGRWGELVGTLQYANTNYRAFQLFLISIHTQ